MPHTSSPKGSCNCSGISLINIPSLPTQCDVTSSNRQRSDYYRISALFTVAASSANQNAAAQLMSPYRPETNFGFINTVERLVDDVSALCAPSFALLRLLHMHLLPGTACNAHLDITAVFSRVLGAASKTNPVRNSRNCETETSLGSFLE